MTVLRSARGMLQIEIGRVELREPAKVVPNLKGTSKN
jgi:hypothetical protein